MHVVAFCSQKGGSGKTTLSGHVAVQAELAGAGPAALIDCDPQGSLAAWWNERQSQTPAFATTTLAQLPDDLERLRNDGCQLVIMGTRGNSELSHVQLGSIAERTLRTAPCSVLAVKAEEHPDNT